MFVPRAHGLSSALKKVFDVYEIMQPLPLGPWIPGTLRGLSAGIKSTICPRSAVRIPGF